MDRDLDTHFLQRISSFEKELLEPIVDRSSLDEFTRRWTTLVDDLQTALEADALKSSTVTTAYSLADKVARMIKTLLDLEALAEQLMTSLLDETPPTSPHVHPSTSSETILPLYIKPSHEWLVQNVHNPYPSASVRNDIAQKSRSARKDVDNWFKDARKRIGWNTARKDHFSNKRAYIVDAATRFFANDESLSLSQGAEHALVSLMKNAKDLYSDKFDETILATTLAAVVKDLTPETKAEARAGRIRQAQLKRDRDAYPSPDRSPGSPHTSLLPCDDTIESVTNRKRRSLSIRQVKLDQIEVTRPAKRPRLSSSPEGVAFPLGLPSPASSVDEPLPTTEVANVPSPPASSVATTGRKRRLSGSDSQGAVKRPHHCSADSRPQSACDPLTVPNDVLFDETSFDGWFKQVFDHPEAGETPAGLSVELANLTEFDCGTPTKLQPEPPEFPGKILEPQTEEVTNVLTALDVPWNELDFGWSDLALSSNDTGQFVTLVNSVDQESLPNPLAQNIVNYHLSSQNSPSENDLSFFGLSNPTVVDPVVIPHNLASNETWDFTRGFDRHDNTVFGKTANFASNNGLLASFDFSQGTDLLPSRNVISFPTFPQDKLRQEKEKEFREACEKAQRLALELQKGDLFAS